MEPNRESQLTPRQPAFLGLDGPARAALAVVPALAAGLALRLWMLKSLFQVNGDSLTYGAIAKNLLLHGSYAFSLANGDVTPTLIRLPGYPLYLALCFRLFGMENYFAATLLQIFLELLGCCLLADFAARIAPPRLSTGAGIVALWLAALCPFTASYAVAPMAETLTLFTIALALWAAARFRQRPGWAWGLWFTFAITWSALLRPDGALLAVALAPALVLGLPPESRIHPQKMRRIALVCVLLALTPFAAWTVRNWQAFHVFQPLAPRLATDPGEDPFLGWERWTKTWCLDYISTYQIYWNVPDSPLDVNQLPSRAFDSPAQYAETAALAADYNSQGYNLTHELDLRFRRLAEEREAAHPLRSYVWLPLGRLADMLFRPRVENLDIDLDWWVYAHHHKETVFSWWYVALNAFYFSLAAAALALRPQLLKSMLAFLLMRCALLLTVEAPEARYTLEFFPMLFALGGVALYCLMNRVCRSVLKVKLSPAKG